MSKRPPPPPEWHHELVSHGVTGTNGKTSTVAFLAAALAELARPVASATTLGTFFDELPFESPRNHQGLLACLKEALRRGARHAVLEMTSEALALGYAQAWPCHGGIFTNLTHDHLDAHRSPEHYLASKAQLFMALPPAGYAVLNGCDETSKLLAEVIPAGTRVAHFGLATRGKAHTALDLEAHDVRTTWSGTSANLISTFADMPARLEVRAIGPEQLENALAALSAAVLAGVPAEQAAAAISRARPPAGRFEVFGNGPRVVVDFAHSPDALSRVLRTARSLCEGKLVVVFGAGGNRDRDKRPAMGEAARAADHVLLTTDNCRDEAPAAICEAIRTGLAGHEHVSIVLQRDEAIGRAVAQAGAADVVLIAGRGPERELVVGEQRLLLVDGQVATAALARRGLGHGVSVG